MPPFIFTNRSPTSNSHIYYLRVSIKSQGNSKTGSNRQSPMYERATTLSTKSPKKSCKWMADFPRPHLEL